jgi:hypothetical protein
LDEFFISARARRGEGLRCGGYRLANASDCARGVSSGYALDGLPESTACRHTGRRTRESGGEATNGSGSGGCGGSCSGGGWGGSKTETACESTSDADAHWQQYLGQEVIPTEAPLVLLSSHLSHPLSSRADVIHH